MRLVSILPSLLIAASTMASAFSIPSTFDASSHLPSGHHISSDFLVTRRQNARPSPSPVVNGSTPLPPTNATSSKYEEAILTSCTAALTLLASKPESLSGMSLCYNILQLNNATGVFKSDLRLFKTTEPREAWTNISSRDLVPSVEFKGSRASLAGEPKRANPVELFTGVPQLKESYVFVGQINPQFLNRTMNITTLQSLLLPIVSLSVRNTNRTTILPMNEASFLLNVFSATPMAAKPFVLPGITIKIFPIGLIITGSWTVLFAAIVGWGAVKKMHFREHYRRRLARDVAAGRGGLRI